MRVPERTAIWLALGAYLGLGGLLWLAWDFWLFRAGDLAQGLAIFAGIGLAGGGPFLMAAIVARLAKR